MIERARGVLLFPFLSRSRIKKLLSRSVGRVHSSDRTRYSIWKRVRVCGFFTRYTEQIAWRFSCVVKVSPRSVSLFHGRELLLSTRARLEDGFASQDPKVKARATGLRGSEIRCRHILRQFNEYVIRSLRYGNPRRGLYSASDALSLPEVDCGGFDSLFCALCIASGIPGRIVSGFWPGTDAETAMHAWCEVCLPDGSWVPADPSIEHLVRAGRDRTKSGRLGYVGSDRVVFSVGSNIPIELEGGTATTVDLLQHPTVVVREGGAPQLSFDLSIIQQ